MWIKIEELQNKGKFQKVLNENINTGKLNLLTESAEDTTREQKTEAIRNLCDAIGVDTDWVDFREQQPIDPELFDWTTRY